MNTIARHTSSVKKLVDTAEVRQALTYLVEPGQVFELRALNATTPQTRNPYTVSGYFNDIDALIKELASLQTAQGVYITLHPCKRDLLARAKNRLRSFSEMKGAAATADTHIDRYRLLLIDCDPERPSGISSSDEEHDKALAKAQEIRRELSLMGWPEPISADSGNGAHLLYLIDVPVKESALIQRVLQGLAGMFDSEGLHIDQGVYNPSRISKLYGTLACKGDDTDERPHRMSRIIEAPATFSLVPLSLLEAMAAPLEPKKSYTATGGSGGQALNGEQFVREHNLDVRSPVSWNGGLKWVFNVCPFNSDHTNGSAVLIQFASGALSFKCHHNSCRGYEWKDVRAKYEPPKIKATKNYRDDEPATVLSHLTPEDAPTASNGNGHGSNGHAVPSQKDVTRLKRLQFIIEGQLKDQEARALDVLKQTNCKAPQLFMHLSSVSKVGKDELGSPIIMQLDRAGVRHELSCAADFFRPKTDPKTGIETLVEAHPPKDLADQLLSRSPGEWPIPPLKTLVEAPVLRSDGSILDTPGYDAITHLYYVPADNMAACKVPAHPTRNDAITAMNFLRPIFADFPFESQSDYANAFALLFTPFVRFAVKKDIQMALLDANNAGTGKGLMANIVSIAATGKPTTPMTAKKDDDEWRKAILTELLQAPRIVIIDNIRGVLESQALEVILTGEGLNERILGSSKSAKPKNEATWIATGNNLLIGGDLPRRCYRIRMISPTATPEERPDTDFSIPQLEQWTSDHRREIVTAILTVARAWYVAGCPKSKNVPNLGTFTDWAKTIGGILEYAGVEGFQANRDELRSRNNEEAQEWTAFLSAWHKIYGSEWIPTATLAEKIAEKIIIENKPSANLLFETMPQYLKKTLADKPNSFSISLGIQLQKRVQTVYGSDAYRIEKQVDSHTKSTHWKVTRGVADGYSTLRVEKVNSLPIYSGNVYSGRDNNPTQPTAPSQGDAIQESEKVPSTRTTSGVNDVLIESDADTFAGGSKKSLTPATAIYYPGDVQAALKQASIYPKNGNCSTCHHANWLPWYTSSQQWVYMCGNCYPALNSTHGAHKFFSEMEGGN